MSDEQKTNLAVPVAIVVAGIIVGGAIFFTMENGKPLTGLPSHAANANPASGTVAKNIPPVTAADHIQGSLDAPVIIVEYDDLECPFCKQFDGTMQQVMAAYPGKVAWVIRNFPLQQLHPNAPKLALAAECVAELGGNDAYWKFLDDIIAAAPPATPCTQLGSGCSFFDMTKLTPTAQSVGVDGKAFDSCVASGTYQQLVTDQFNDAVTAGGQGTPFSVLVTKSGTQVPISGSQPLDYVKQLIDTALKNS